MTNIAVVVLKDAVVRRYETKLSGYVNGTYYGYETVDGFNEYGQPPVKDPQDRLRQLNAGMTERSIESESVSTATEQHLSDLGYI